MEPSMKLKAIVTQEFPGRPDSESLPRTIKVGETVTGDLARVAIENKWAEEDTGSTAAAAQPKKAAPRKARPVAKPKARRAR
jgi:hypothetical protein